MSSVSPAGPRDTDVVDQVVEPKLRIPLGPGISFRTCPRHHDGTLRHRVLKEALGSRDCALESSSFILVQDVDCDADVLKGSPQSRDRGQKRRQ